MAAKKSRNSGYNSGDRRIDAPVPVMVRRIGAPPLRFKGRELARHVHKGKSGTASIVLWQSKTGVFVASVASASFCDAASRETLEDLIGWLEQACPARGVHDPLEGQRASDRTHPDMTAVDSRQAVRILVGEALDHWDHLAEERAAIG